MDSSSKLPSVSPTTKTAEPGHLVHIETIGIGGEMRPLRAFRRAVGAHAKIDSTLRMLVRSDPNPDKSEDFGLASRVDVVQFLEGLV